MRFRVKDAILVRVRISGVYAKFTEESHQKLCQPLRSSYTISTKNLTLSPLDHLRKTDKNFMAKGGGDAGGLIVRRVGVGYILGFRSVIYGP